MKAKCSQLQQVVVLLLFELQVVENPKKEYVMSSVAEMAAIHYFGKLQADE